MLKFFLLIIQVLFFAILLLKFTLYLTGFLTPLIKIVIKTNDGTNEQMK
jgi:hypothetical protein